MTHPEPTIRSIPLSRLELAPENVRKTPGDPTAFAELKASIAAHGLLENLIVRVEDTGGAPGSGPKQAPIERCAVVAGGRRLAAMKALAERGRPRRGPPRALPGDRRGGERRRAVPRRERGACRHAPRGPGHRVHQTSPKRVSPYPPSRRASALAERLVEQRLSLGGAAPELLDAYRAEEMDLDTLKAFTVTTDHARQMAVWEQSEGITATGRAAGR